MLTKNECYKDSTPVMAVRYRLIETGRMKVDLEATIQLRGSNYSLIDQMGPCRVCTSKAI